MKNISLLMLCSLIALSVQAEHKELKAFPPAAEGMQRHVIELPHRERSEEGAYKVELVAGKTMWTDGANIMRHSARIEPRPLVGWGYTFYDVVGRDVAMSTLMAPPPGSKKVQAFVGGQPLLINYNSRLPIVIYAAAGYEIRYRIWRADPEFRPADGE